MSRLSRLALQLTTVKSEFSEKVFPGTGGILNLRCFEWFLFSYLSWPGYELRSLQSQPFPGFSLFPFFRRLFNVIINTNSTGWKLLLSLLLLFLVFNLNFAPLALIFCGPHLVTFGGFKPSCRCNSIKRPQPQVATATVLPINFSCYQANPSTYSYTCYAIQLLGKSWPRLHYLAFFPNRT